MEAKKAIQVIKNNYPPEAYTALREALDMAMDAIEKSEATKQILTSEMDFDVDTSEAISDLRDLFGIK